jgi:hypothetical protein
LNADQSRDALAALERLETLRQTSGRRFSLLAAVSDFAEAVDKLRLRGEWQRTGLGLASRPGLGAGSSNEQLEHGPLQQLDPTHGSHTALHQQYQRCEPDRILPVDGAVI